MNKHLKIKNKNLLDFDKNLTNKYQVDYLIGIDEAGKGALAGPIYIAGVSFLSYYYHPLVYDSKALTSKQREIAAAEILKTKLIYKIVKVKSVDIDTIGLNNAIALETKKLLLYFQNKLTSYLFIADFSPVFNRFQNCNLVNLKKADQLSFHVAAASIIAKVHRDQEMKHLNEDFPFYNFDQNKGYGTNFHIQQIKKSGYCPLHRKTFKIKKLIY